MTQSGATSPRGLVDVQEGILSRPQAQALGISRHLVRSQVRARRWQLAGSRVVVMHNGTLTQAQRQWAALLNAGQRAALCAATAAALDGLVGYPSPVIHVMTPVGVRVPPLPGVRLHVSRHLAAIDVHPVRVPRRTRLPRSVIDMAASASDDDRAAAIVLAALQQRLASADDLRSVVARLGPVRRRRIVLAAVGDGAAGAHSLAEVDLIRLCRRWRLPAPTSQGVRHERSGRRRYLDAEWPAWHLAVEVDGGAHREVRPWWADMARQNAVTLDGTRLYRFPAMVVRLHPEQVAEVLRQGLMQAGWRPPAGRSHVSARHR